MLVLASFGIFVGSFGFLKVIKLKLEAEDPHSEALLLGEYIDEFLSSLPLLVVALAPR